MYRRNEMNEGRECDVTAMSHVMAVGIAAESHTSR